MQVAESKRRNKETFFRPAREKRVYQRVEELNKGPLRRENVRSIYREIIAAWPFCGWGHVSSEYGASLGTSMPLPVSRPSSLFAWGIV